MSLRTGYGKSLCYALLPSIFDLKRKLKDKTSIVIFSPLVALTKDQASVFTEKGISAGYVRDKQYTDKETRRKVRVEYQLVFISPEALFLAIEWRRMLSKHHYRRNLGGFVVDEAYCVQKWLAHS